MFFVSHSHSLGRDKRRGDNLTFPRGGVVVGVRWASFSLSCAHGFSIGLQGAKDNSILTVFSQTVVTTQAIR